jgi:hypothetical protein
MTEKHHSDSTTQIELEKIILEKIIEYNPINVKLENQFFSNALLEPLENPKLSFLIDFYNIEKRIFGEIYVCKFPLKSGHLRKIKSDILKLLTIEKIVGDIDKYIVLTIELNVNQGSIQTEDSLKKFKENSWLSYAIKKFNIHILYYVLQPEEARKLNAIRLKQRNGMTYKK